MEISEKNVDNDNELIVYNYANPKQNLNKN